MPGRSRYKGVRLYEPGDLTDEEKEAIYTMLFGPYKDEWRSPNGVIDNSDVTIAKRLFLHVSLVSNYTDFIVYAQRQKAIEYNEEKDRQREKSMLWEKEPYIIRSSKDFEFYHNDYEILESILNNHTLEELWGDI